MRNTEFICVSTCTKTHEKGGNRIKLVNYILHFQAGLFSQHIKAMLKIEFQKLNSKLSIFAVYET